MIPELFPLLYVETGKGGTGFAIIKQCAPEAAHYPMLIAWSLGMKRECLLKSLKDLKVLKESLPSGKPSPQTETDDELFREAMAGVREIREFREIPYKKSGVLKCRIVHREDGVEMLKQVVKGERGVRLSDTGEYMEWAGRYVRGDITKKLHRGDFAVQDSIDLHGMTLREAEEALDLFFRGAVKKRLFCIKVIHGRGLGSPNGPVLKEAFRRLLHGAFSKWVLAYATARDCDGGLGATYVILK